MTDEKVEQQNAEQAITQPGPADGVAEAGVTSADGVAEKTVPEGVEQTPTDDADKASEQELRETLSMVQGGHQRMVEVLKRNYGPEFYASIKEQSKEVPGDQVVVPPTVSPDGEAAEEYVDPSIRRLEAGLNRLTELVTHQTEQRQVTDKHAEEYAACDRELSGFLAANKIPPALVNRARNIMQGIPGIDVSKPGGPSAYVEGMGTVLTQLIELQYATTPATPTTPTEKTLAERQARDMALATQPGGAPSPMGGPPKDENEKAADDIASDFTEGGVFS